MIQLLLQSMNNESSGGERERANTSLTKAQHTGYG